MAREFGREGVEVVLVSRGIGDLEATSKELAAETGGRYIPIAADTSNEDSIKAMVQRAAEELGHLDILVNGAARVGGSRPAPRLAEITEEDFWDDMKTKVLGYLTCAREVAPHMASQGWGRIINISGLAARQSGTIIGSMRNVSVAAMTKNLADQLGPQGINVTVVHPGLTRTERTAALVEAQMSSQGITAQEAEKKDGRQYLHRPDDRRGGDSLRHHLPGISQVRRDQRRRHSHRGRVRSGDSLLGLHRTCLAH